MQAHNGSRMGGTSIENHICMKLIKSSEARHEMVSLVTMTSSKAMVILSTYLGLENRDASRRIQVKGPMFGVIQ